MCSRIRIWYLRTIVCFYPCGKKAGKLSTNGRKTNTQHGQQQQQRYQLQKNTHREKYSRRIIKMKEKRIKSERWKKNPSSSTSVLSLQTKPFSFLRVNDIFSLFFFVHLFFRSVIFAAHKSQKHFHPLSQSDSKQRSESCMLNFHVPCWICTTIQFLYHVFISPLLLYTLIKPSIFFVAQLAFVLKFIVLMWQMRERERITSIAEWLLQ